MSLSQAESKVVAYLQKGWNNVQIAEALNLTEKTVKFHLTNIFKKYNVKSRSELTAQLNGYTKQNEELIVKEISPKNELAQQNAQMSQVEKIQFVNNTFKVSAVIDQLHVMMSEVTKNEINPATVNAACNCVARLNETINTTIQASRFLNEK